MLQRPIKDHTAPSGLTVIKNNIRSAVPYPYSIEAWGDLKLRVKGENKAFSHGAYVTGDGRVEARKLRLGLYIRSNTEQEHDKALNFIYTLFARRDYTLIAGRPDRVYNIAALTDIKHKYIKGFRGRRSDLDITLLLADPFRYAAQPVIKKYTVILGGNLIELYNPGADTPLIITLSPAASMPDVAITHTQTGYTCRIRDSLLTNPAILTADTVDGTVRRGNLNAINAFSGQFLSALPGVNNYKVTGAAGEVTFTFTPRWLV